MSTLQKPNSGKRKQRDEAPNRCISTRSQRMQSLSPIQNDDDEDDPRTKEKIITELRKELAETKTEAAEAVMLKKQRDFAVHIAAGFCDLQRDMFVTWNADLQKLAATRHFQTAREDFVELFHRSEAIENVLTTFPKLDRAVHTHVGAHELEEIKGQVEDFRVDMVEKDTAAETSY
jgi:hypothetical protein